MKQDIRDSLIFTGILASAILVLVTIFFRSKPDMPPELTEDSHVKIKVPFLAEIKVIFQDKNTIQILLASSFSISYTFIFPTILESMTNIYDFSTSQTSYLGTIYSFSGILGCITFAIIIEKKKTFKLVSLIIGCFSIGCNC